MTTKVQINLDILLDFLDQQEGGKLYPQLSGKETITRVNINPVTAEFIISEPHSPYSLAHKSK